MNILLAVIVLGAMGLLFGIGLTAASNYFAVEPNPTRDAVRDQLPGANCGGCGFPGCDGCADAIAAGKAAPNACPVCSKEAAAKIAEIMGVEAPSGEKLVASVICQGDKAHCKNKFEYVGIEDCVAATAVADGYRACRWACLGLGTCAKTCPFGAITIDKSRMIAVIDPDKCQSCGKCVAACPKKVIAMQPVTTPNRLLCRAAEEGYLVTDNCRMGCNGCERCKIACKFDAIEMVNHLPKVDTEKCVGCMMCAEACPTHAMWADWENRKIASIDKSACVGCTMCKRNCKFDAIIGDLKQVHTVTNACTGCGECAKKCPKKCITLKVRDHARDNHATVTATVEPVLAVKPAAGVTPAAKPKVELTPEQQAKIQAALAAKAAREKAAAEAAK